MPVDSLSARPVAIAHDFLIQMGGAENVVEVVAKTFPDAPIFTSATFGDSLYQIFKSDRVHNTWMQHLPGMARHHKKLFLLYPLAFQSLHVPEGSLTWISSSSFSKWLPKPRGAHFVCYCHTPPRFFWYPDAYLKNEIGSRVIRTVVKALIPLLRWSDHRQARKVDLFVANSKNVQQRIRACYGRESVVIYPPVDVERFTVSDHCEDFFLIVSRLVAYKRVDLAVRAFTESGRKLVVIGDGPDRSRLESMAGPNVRFLGRATDATVTENMTNCRGFVLPGSEDFGITPVEAQACGKPVIAFREGGALETVIDGRTGVFFDEPTPASLIEALDEFETMTWDRAAIRHNAERFAIERFVKETRAVLAGFGEAPAPSQKRQPSRAPVLVGQTSGVES